MSEVHPKSLRDAKIKSVSHGGDTVRIEMENGNSHEVHTEWLIDDWLTLHNKLQAAKEWMKRAKESGVEDAGSI